MPREVHCKLLGKPLPGLERTPWPGEIGERVYETISQQAWKMWQERQVMLINEYQLNTLDENAIKLLEDHMVGFLFGEGDYVGALPDGYTPINPAS